MLPAAIIAKKRDCQELTPDEIRFMVRGLVDNSIADYQLSAWAMAILCRGMSDAEIACLTDEMLASGGRLDRVSQRPRVDKHSTGGLGDKVSLILTPLLACFEVDVPMLSGRGLGITGGTLDKLESFAGINCQLTREQINTQIRELGCVITGTTADIAAADRKLYALRDVTGTVPSIALITSSIMSKKLAATLDALVLDVKFGSGAFMQDIANARELARCLCATGQRMRISTQAVLSDMNQPLGRSVGNACEVNESLDVLRGIGPQDVRELTLRLAAELLLAVDRFDELRSATRALQSALTDGRALERFRQMIEFQGGKFVERLPTADSHVVLAPKAGWIASINGGQIGQAIIGLGGGRRRLGDAIDHSVGIEMLVRIGDQVDLSQPIVRVFARHAASASCAAEALRSAVEVSESPIRPLQLIYEPPSS